MRVCLFSLVLLLSAGAAQAQMYKWIGPDGKINYTDTPPPPSAKQVETKAPPAGETPAADLPYALAEAAKAHPVVLFTGPNCIPCDDGRKLLNSRGIPYRERTVRTNDDIAQFRQAGGADQLPLLLVGRSKQEGFSISLWNDALSAAGYPAASALPKGYHNPPPESAAPRQEPPPQQQPGTAEAGDAKPPAAAEPPPAAGNAPPGFRF